MILRADIIEIGVLLKPHGINGEITAEIDENVDLESLRCIILGIDGIFVPFFINSIRQRSATSQLITIDGITNDSDAKQLCGLPVYALKSEVASANDADSDGYYLSDLIGYKAIDSDGATIGHVQDFDDSTENALLIINTHADGSGFTIYVPAADEFFLDINSTNQTITLSLPEGLTDL